MAVLSKTMEVLVVLMMVVFAAKPLKSAVDKAVAAVRSKLCKESARHDDDAADSDGVGKPAAAVEMGDMGDRGRGRAADAEEAGLEANPALGST